MKRPKPVVVLIVTLMYCAVAALIGWLTYSYAFAAGVRVGMGIIERSDRGTP